MNELKPIPEEWLTLLNDEQKEAIENIYGPLLIIAGACLLYTSPSPRDATLSRMPSSA